MESGQAHVSAQRLPTATWLCVEVVLEISETSGSVSLSLDGAEVLYARNVDTSLPGGISRVSIGVDFAAPSQSSATVLIDDLVVSSRVYDGCPQ